ncbi:MAG: PAS domain S-box protein [Halieaceae bacterium]|jgi:PAS domain S-box-containing protein|nr:PAS domain S-box protein [Halieaceae bacterium]
MNAKGDRVVDVLDLFFRNSHTAFVLLDREFNFIRVNELFASMNARNISEFPGRNYFEMYPSNVEQIFKEVRRSKQSDQIVARPFEFVDHPDWGVTYWDWSLLPILSEDDEVIYFCCSLNNVTARVRSEQEMSNLRHELEVRVETRTLELQKSEEKYRAYVENAPGGIFISDSTGHYVDVNKGACDLLGYSGSELLGMAITDVIQDGMRNQLVADFRRFEESGSLEAEYQFKRKDGAYRDVSLKGAILPNGHYLGFCTDITERKKTEAGLHKYSHIVSSSSDLLALVNNNYIYEAVNTAHADNFNKSSEEVVGQSIAEMYGTETFDSVIKPNVERCLAGETVNYQAWFNFPGIGKRYMDIVYSPYTDVENVIQGFAESGRDMTEQRQLEEELLKARKLESVGTLAGGIAHDFNNILARLLGSVELAMLELTEDHPASSYIQSATQALESASSLTHKLLTFAEGGAPLLEIVNIKQVIQDSVELTLSGSNVKMVMNLSDELWQVKADAGQLLQVITNLTTNAKQAMSHGGSLYVDGENIEDIEKGVAPNLSGDFVKFCIRDEGVGIDADDLGKIFDPYFTTRQASGGLGLASVHSIITKHNGHVGVESTPGTGTTFTIYLPAEKSPLPVVEDITPGVTESTEPATGRILVMDDDEMIRSLSIDILESFGYSVDTAPDGEEALALYVCAEKAASPYDIVIMDLTIPGGMGGEETIAQLLAIDPGARVIVSSGYSTDTVMANYREYGFMGRLLKPFKMVELEKEVRRVVAQGRPLGIE